MSQKLNKQNAPVEVELTRGAILPGELTRLLTIAARDATFIIVTLIWSDGSQASTIDINEIEPIEDAVRVKTVFARFQYGDESNLIVWLSQACRSFLGAVGDTAREHQSNIALYWASLPQRSPLTYRSARWLRSLPTALGGGSTAFFVAGVFSDHSMASWALRIGFLLIAVCSYLFIRSTHAIRAFSRLVVLVRPPRRNIWTAIAGVSAIATLCLSLVSYLFPRR